jgi:hypothetical protein
MLIYELADHWRLSLEEVEAMPRPYVNGWLAYFSLKKEKQEGANGR